MSRSRSIALAVVGGCVFALPTQAQNVADTLPAAPEAIPSQAPKSLCFRGAPLPFCKAFLITEVAYHVQEESDGRGGDAFVSWTNGFMVNLTSRDAIGATLRHVGIDNGQGCGRNALLLRYRRWVVQERVGFDLSVGRIGTANGDPRSGRHIADLGMSLGDFFGMFGQTLGSPEGLQPSAGFKFGSWPGLILGVVSNFYYQLGCRSN